jgi:hypothetical protein
MQHAHAFGYQTQVLLHQPKQQVIEIHEQHAVIQWGIYILLN